MNDKSLDECPLDASCQTILVVWSEWLFSFKGKRLAVLEELPPMCNWVDTIKLISKHKERVVIEIGQSHYYN